jgi:hypothetical protein
MASIRYGTREDKTIYTQVLYRARGRQRSTFFDDHGEALNFRDLVDQLGPENAREIARLTNQAGPNPDRRRMAGPLRRPLTGLDPRTIQKYRGYLRADVAPALGVIPLVPLSRDDIARWPQSDDRRWIQRQDDREQARAAVRRGKGRPHRLDKLTYSGEWLFTNPGNGGRGAGGPVRAVNFRAIVWYPRWSGAGRRRTPTIAR